MRLTLVISSLSGGGAERVMSLLANAWASEGVDTSLITLSAITDDAYALNSSVRRIGIDLISSSDNAAAAVLANFRRVRKLREALQDLRPDVLVSFMTSTNVLSVLAARPLKLPVIVAERVAPDAHRIPRPWRYLRSYTYRRAAMVVAQTNRSAMWLRGALGGATVEVIANPIKIESGQSPDEASRTATAACEGYNVVLGAGRLTRQKGFDLLIRAFAALASKRPSWRLAIFGEGPEGDTLRALCGELRISDRVVFAGFSRTLHFMMQSSQLFVLPSRYEGMPNALGEAMACAMPCISFDCPTGPAELIFSGRDGMLVPPEDVARLTSAMDCLMGDEALRRRLGNAARESAKAYSMEKILDHWNSLLARATLSA